MGVTNRLVFDPTEAASHSNVGAYVRAGTDGDLIGSETLNSLEWLRTSGPIIDSAGNEVGVTSNALDVNIASGALVLDWTFDYAEDSAHSSGDIGAFVLGVRQDTLAASTSADGDYAAFKVDAVGSMYVADSNAAALLTTIDADTGSIASDTAAMVVDLAAIEVEQLAQGVTLDSILVDTGTIASDTTSIDAAITALSKSEDAAHVSGDQGIMGLAVANHTEGAVHSADGDYAPLQVDSSGRLRVVGQLDLDDDLADTAILASATAVSTTAINVVSSVLANRKHVFFANLGNKALYIGQASVTAAIGFPLFPGEKMEARIGPSVVTQVIGGTGASAEDMRVLQLS